MYIFIKALDVLLMIIQMALFIRAILSWIPNMSRDNPFMILLDQVTEPILAPVRSLVNKSSFGQNSMLDISFLVTFLIVHILRTIVGRMILGM